MSPAIEEYGTHDPLYSGVPIYLKQSFYSKPHGRGYTMLAQGKTPTWDRMYMEGYAKQHDADPDGCLFAATSIAAGGIEYVGRCYRSMALRRSFHFCFNVSCSELIWWYCSQHDALTDFKLKRDIPQQIASSSPQVPSPFRSCFPPAPDFHSAPPDFSA